MMRLTQPTLCMFWLQAGHNCGSIGGSGKQWRAKAVAVHSATQSKGDYPRRDALQLALEGAALSEDDEAQQEAVVISYCWYHHTLSRSVASNAKRKAVSGLQPTASTRN
jgi:hypothetical protein